MGEGAIHIARRNSFANKSGTLSEALGTEAVLVSEHPARPIQPLITDFILGLMRQVPPYKLFLALPQRKEKIQRIQWDPEGPSSMDTILPSCFVKIGS